VRLIDEAYDRDLSLTEMAQHAGVTPQHLCRVFRQTLRMRPVEYLTQRRVQAAQALIRRGELPLAEIARQTGFSSPGYFSTVFRRCVGMSPGDYRRKMDA
jgi:AraC family transcriptional regulator